MLIDSAWFVLDVSPAVAVAFISGAVAVAVARSIGGGRRT